MIKQGATEREANLIPANIAQKATDQMEQLVINVLAGRIDDECTGKIAIIFTVGRWT